MPKWEGKIFAGDSQRVGVSRSQANEFVSASDPVFDGFIAMSASDFRSFYATYVLGCKEWRKGAAMMSAEEAALRIQMLSVDLDRAAKAEREAREAR